MHIYLVQYTCTKCRGEYKMLAQRLRYVRKIRGLSQEELGKKINSTKSTISNYENEYSTPSNEVLKDLADVLNTTTDYLLGRTERVEPKEDSELEKILSDPQTNIMFKDWEKMTIEQRQEALNFIRFLREKEKSKK